MDWTPIEDKTPSPLNEQLDAFVKAGSPVAYGWRGVVVVVVYAIVIAVILAIIVGMVRGYDCMIDINCVAWLR